VKKFLIILGTGILWCNFVFASNANENLNMLKNLYEEGALTKQEFLKAKSIILKSKNEEIVNTDFTLRTYKKSPGGTQFEKMELLFDDYRLYTYRPGGVKIIRVSTEEKLVTFSSKFKIKFFKDGRDLFDFILDEEKEKISVRFRGREIMHWEGRYVEKHQAYFFQMLALGHKPFHFYIKLPGGRQVALNMNAFTNKIDRAVAKAKIRLASKYNISLEQINRVLKQREKRISKEIEGIIDEEKQKLIKELSNNVIQASINTELQKEIERSIGEAMADELISAIEQASGQAIEQAVSDELSTAIDQAISEAVAEGVSEAAAAAAIRAMLDVYASGGSDQDAMDACRKHAGDAC
jgi:hypothetical protein